MVSSILGSEWSISPEGIHIITENGSLKDEKKILKNALDSDFKLIGKPVLSSELSKSRLIKVVLQIQKIRNISAPKAKENSQFAPRMLKLTLTDGESYVQAIEISPINSISRENTAPGTKILINGASIVSGYLLINPQNCNILGGQVEHLYDKWLLAKSVQQNHQYASNDGAPPWVAFGCKVTTNEDKSFKSLDKNKDNNSNSEFEQQRKEAIAEASSGAVKKTFGGRVKQNVQPIQNSQQLNKGKYKNERDQNERKAKSSQRDEETFEKLQKPSEKVSLFSFLEDKLPLTESKKVTNQGNLPVTQINREDSKGQQRNTEGFTYNSYNKPNSKSHFEGKLNERVNQNYNYSQPDRKDLSIRSLPQQNSTNVSKNEVHQPNRKGDYYEGNKFNTYQYNRNKSDRNAYQQDVQNLYRDNYGQNQNSYNSYNSKPQYSNNFNQQNMPGNSQAHRPPLNNRNKPSDGEMHTLATALSKMSVNNEFASRSLKQHLNLGQPSKRLEGVQSNSNALNIGDHCMARYWEDGKFYNAVVTAVTDLTYAVRFTGYGNIEEVLKHDCFSTSSPNQNYGNQNSSPSLNQFSGSSMEFRRRGPPRK